MPLDPAVHAFRDDIADVALAGRVIAPHYAEAVMREVMIATPMKADASEHADDIVRLGVGTRFAVLDCGRGLAWGYALEDHRVGYIDEDALS